jgi:hypothetical protein
MANTNAPFGFKQIGRLPGSPPNYAQATYFISSSYNVAIGNGDAVIPVAAGYIQQATASTVQLAGIFIGCKYLSTALQRVIWSRYWPGSGATGDVEAYVVNDSAAIFEVQSSAAATPFSSLGSNMQLVAGTPNTATGQSTMSLLSGSEAVTDTLPFRVVGFRDPVLPGGDIASSYNVVQVAFNNQQFKTLTGIA